MEVRVYDSQGPLLDSFKLVNEEARKASTGPKILNVLYILEALRHNNIMPGLLPG